MLFPVNGELWESRIVPPGSPELRDWTGTERLGTADYAARTIYLSSELEPPLLDRVALHEVAHAVIASHGLLRETPLEDRRRIDEWTARVMEEHALEAVSAASTALGRPVCVEGVCNGRPR